jgi:hypothetical protein
MRRVPGTVGLLLALATLLAGCRPVAVESDPGLPYAIEVTNTSPHAMVVFFDDGRGERQLGTVAANSRDRFIVAGAARPTVTIVARDQAGGHTIRREVTLQAGATIQVAL